MTPRPKPKPRSKVAGAVGALKKKAKPHHLTLGVAVASLTTILALLRDVAATQKAFVRERQEKVQVASGRDQLAEIAANLAEDLEVSRDSTALWKARAKKSQARAIKCCGSRATVPTRAAETPPPQPVAERRGPIRSFVHFAAAPVRGLVSLFTGRR